MSLAVNGASVKSRTGLCRRRDAGRRMAAKMPLFGSEGRPTIEQTIHDSFFGSIHSGGESAQDGS